MSMQNSRLMNPSYTLTCIVLLILLSLPHAFAEVTSRSGSNDQSQALIQQLGAERTRLNAENAKLKKKLKEAEKSLEEFKDDNAKTEKKLSSVQSQLNTKANLSESLTERLKQSKARLEELIAKFRETVKNLRTVERENAQRGQEISRLERELTTCAASNVALSELGYEVLDNYENKGFWDRAGQIEPFTQLKRVQIENLVDEYTYLIQDQQYNAPEDLQTNSE